MTINDRPPPIGITLGDPAGIGPEIVAALWRQAPDLARGCLVAGDLAALRRGAAAAGGAPLPVCPVEHPAQAWDMPPRCVPLLQVGTDCLPSQLPAWGQISAQAGRMAGDAVFWAARAALRGQVAAIVTAPLHKEALAAAGAPYGTWPGHTELLQAEAAAHAGVPIDQMPVRMMLVNDQLRTVLVTIHTSLRQALDAVTFDKVLQTLQISHRFVGKMLQKTPRIAVAGLNPHAGEGGRFGREEIEVIAPAVVAARAQGIDAHGPLAPDTVFMRARHDPAQGKTGEFDLVVAMYHDQGLIPVKYLGVEQGVNVTLGLHDGQGRPLVRTSPDHGTALDIAGRGSASARSLCAAVRMAKSLCDFPKPQPGP